MEGNKYYINSINLDKILKRMDIFLSQENKGKIIKIINSKSVSQEITKSDFDYNTKILILRIFIEHKKNLINEITPIIYDKEPENKNDCYENDINNEIDLEIEKGIQEKLEENEDILIDCNGNNLSDYNGNNLSDYNGNNLSDYNEKNLSEYNGNNSSDYNEKNSLDMFNKLIEIKTNIFKMKNKIIESLKYENTQIYNEICDYEDEYYDKKKFIQEYRYILDLEVDKNRRIQDEHYRYQKNNIIDKLVIKYIDNKKNIDNYLLDNLNYYDNQINYEGQIDMDKKYIDKNEYENKKEIDNKYIENQKEIDNKYIENKKEMDKNYIDDEEDSYELELDKNQIKNIQNNKNSLKKVFNKLRANNKDYDNNETDYFNKLDDEVQKNINDIEKKIKEINLDNVPIRFKVLEKNLTIENKAMIINKLNEYKKNKYLSDSTKYFNWLHGLLKIPFGEYKKLPITSDNDPEEIKNYLEESKNILDSAVYGHEETKENIIQLIAQWVTNPQSSGNVIGIQGPMGNGKTTLVKNGIAKAIKRPFEFISLGGSGDSSYLDGHSYTYEGATWGKIVDVLIKSNCMNPVFYFDELDKISNTAKGDELMNLLIHITDITQNTKFQDKYFSGIDIDLSKAVFIFSYNDQDRINPILLDRLIQIKTTGFETKDKIQIFNSFLYKNISNNLGINKKINFSDEIIKLIIEKYTDEKGVRHLNKIIYSIMSKINLSLLIGDNKYKEKNNVININENIIKEIINDKKNINEVIN